MKQTYEIKGSPHDKCWNENAIVGAETITLLELMEVIAKRGKGVRYRKLIIGFDNRTAHNGIVKEILKPTVCAKDGGAVILKIKSLKNEIEFDIEFKLITN